MSDRLLIETEGHSELLLGNEAIVRGAIEAGVAFACGYPGTPSSEVTDSFARLAPRLGIPFEYSVNEKIALEMAFAASLAGARAIVAMKHLGLTYAGDPLTTIPYIGTVAGLVIVSAADPSCRTSPNEQDQRHLADMLHIPMLDPSEPQEALAMTRFAFELSERSRLPVVLRPTTRVCHTRGVVTYGAPRAATVAGFVRDPKRFVPVPANARRMRREIDERLASARAALDEIGGFATRSGAGAVGILATGAPGALVADLLDDAGVAERVTLLRLGAVYPLPDEWLLASLRDLETLLVVEELSPYLEDYVRSLCSLHGLSVRVLGKRTGHFPFEFEYEPQVVRRALRAALSIGADAPAVPELSFEAPAPRLPVLCASCAHRSAFFAAREAFGDDALFFNDIGCYTLGASPPLSSGDALLCMGAGFSLAAGVSRADGRRTVGFMGDSTFFHSGMPALLNAIKERANMVAVILDNQVTAMTGFQDSPGVEAPGGGVVRRDVDIEAIVRALGAAHVETVDPAELSSTIAAFERARDGEGTSVIIARRPCAVFYRRAYGAGDTTPYAIDGDRCGHCGRSDHGQRCDQAPNVAFERVMARARATDPRGEVHERPLVAPCASACPLHLCVQGYAGHIAAGQYGEALTHVMARLPLPSSVCRVCDEPCSYSCVRADLDASVAINGLKRFVVDWADARSDFPYRPEREPDHGKRVAVVGAGPAGLAAAHELRLRGYAVTLFDAESEPGGLLLTGIPRYRLPLEALRRDVARILETGVRFEGGRRLGADLRLAELIAEHDAVHLAIGAHVPIAHDFTGTDRIDVVDALDYLRAHRDVETTNGRRAVLVVGGGNSAIDAARTARRLGAERVVLACLEARDEMPAIADEIAAAQSEGIEIHTRTRVVRVGDGAVELERVEPRTPGVFHPDAFDAVAGTRRDLELDQLVVAFGQRPDATLAGPLLEVAADGTLAVDPDSCRSSHPKVFAAGDLARGGRPATVTSAIAGGLRAAWGIDRALRGAELADRRMPPPIPPHPRTAFAGTARRAPLHEPLDEESARAEAARCLHCGQCGNCRSCLDLFGCPAMLATNGNVGIDAALCVGCGVCAQYCPNGAIARIEAEAKA